MNNTFTFFNQGEFCNINTASFPYYQNVPRHCHEGLFYYTDQTLALCTLDDCRKRLEKEPGAAPYLDILDTVELKEASYERLFYTAQNSGFELERR